MSGGRILRQYKTHNYLRLGVESTHMPLEPTSWNIVLLGAWNPAIFSPKGINQIAFQLVEGTPMAVEIPIDSTGSARVTHEGIRISLENDRVFIELTPPTWDSMARALNLACNVLDNLPRTPLRGGGVNFRFSSTDGGAIAEAIQTPTLDAQIGSAGYDVRVWGVKRTVEFDPGVLNLTMVYSEEGNSVEFNFHKDGTTAADLRPLFTRNTSDFRECVEQIQDAILK